MEWKITLKKINCKITRRAFQCSSQPSRSTHDANAFARATRKVPLVFSSEFKSKEMMDLVMWSVDKGNNGKTNDEDHDNEFLLLQKPLRVTLAP